jgi:hypothetical protein
MTAAADDHADEAAFEAFLAGRSAPEEAADSFSAVAAFAGAVRATATSPGRPNAALAELLTSPARPHGRHQRPGDRRGAPGSGDGDASP